MRSFLFSERPFSHDAAGTAPSITRVAKKNQGKDSKVISFSEFLNRKQRKTASRADVWKTSFYLDRAQFENPTTSLNKTDTLLQLKNELAVDLKSLFDEHVAQRLNNNYDYGPTGMRNGYTETMSQIALNHVEYLRKAGLSTVRAKQEYAVAQTVEAWMAAVDSEEKFLVWVSPRGVELEGYPGTDPENYVLINVCERTGKHSFLLRQFRSYDLNVDLPQLQENIANTCQGRIADVPNTNQQHPELPIISRLLYLPNDTPLSEITSCIYQNKENWVVAIDEKLPDIPLEAYQVEQAKLTDYCLDEFEKVYGDSTLSADQISSLYDGLIQLTIQKLAKWVDDHAQNYEHRIEQPYQLNLTELDEAWQVRRKELLGNALTKQERSVLDHFATASQLAAGSPMGRLMSMAHCVVGTPFSTALRPDIFQALQINQLTRAQLIDVIGAERAQKWSEGTCLQCKKSGILVGECSICLNCELTMGDQKGLEKESDQLKKYLIDSATPQEKARAAQLHQQLTKHLFKKSIGLQELLDSNYLDPSAIQGSDTISDTTSDTFSKIAEVLYQSTNPIQTLETIIQRLTIFGTNSDLNHNNNLLFQANDTGNNFQEITVKKRAAA
ncbi:MAG: hypothetical protein WDZ94_05875 [Patescibacteria group bacterium]